MGCVDLFVHESDRKPRWAAGSWRLLENDNTIPHNADCAGFLVSVKNDLVFGIIGIIGIKDGHVIHPFFAGPLPLHDVAWLPLVCLLCHRKKLTVTDFGGHPPAC